LSPLNNKKPGRGMPGLSWLDYLVTRTDDTIFVKLVRLAR